MMLGDFSRLTFKPEKHFTRVLKQQGRVDLDADANELVEIITHLARQQGIDVIGRAGVPKAEPGFGIVQVIGDTLEVSSGRIYVDGIVCELSQNTMFTIVTPPTVGDAARNDFVYLDVWERHITAIEDPDIRESALGGPDTTTRTKTIYQIRLLQNVGDVTCEADIRYYPPTATDARLTSRADAPPESTDPCIIAPGGGYRGLENLFYRVEIHNGSDTGAPTFKWSRYNGAVLYAVEEFISGEPEKVRVKQLGRDQLLTLSPDDWVEVSDDATDLSQQPGIMAQIVDIDEAQRILTLSKPVTGLSPSGHPKVRRWDQPSDAIAITASEIPLENGITVQFSGTRFDSGDYWQFAARTVMANGISGIDELTDAPPHGVHHHYAPLALLVWGVPTEGTTIPIDILDCRKPFPPLNNITAKDVYFDNSACQLVNAETVQDALDRLCNLNDLRHHNKHLHGWGVVCGLQVICGPNADGVLRRYVTVRDGYAIDCEGNNLILEQPIQLDLMSEIERLLQVGELGNVNLEKGFDVMLSMRLDEQNQVMFKVEPYDPTSRFNPQSMFSHTLLMDFYEHCIKRLIDALRLEFAVPEGEAERAAETPVTPYMKRLISLGLLLLQLIYPEYGRYAFLSASSREDKSLREHDILLQLFLRLRELIRSETFCALFDDDPPFPDYPFREHGIVTFFGKDSHPRLRVSQDGSRGYTMGTDKFIHVYNMELGEMIQVLEVPGGDALIVRDIVFTKEGRVMHAIATVNEADTIFATAEINGDEYKWQPINIICDVKLVTLGLLPELSKDIYAIGVNKGLYAINPENIPAEIEPLVEFNAVSHMQTIPATNSIFATASDTTVETTNYNQFIHIELTTNGPQTTVNPLINPATNNLFSGNDDILVVEEQAARHRVLIVVDDPTQEKLLLHYVLPASATGGAVIYNAALPLSNTMIRLGYVQGSQYVMVSLADRFRILLFNLSNNEIISEDEFAFPVEFLPMHIVHEPNFEKVYVKHFGTILSIPQQYMTPDDTGVTPRPGSMQFLEDLAHYRDAVMLAFFGLAGNLLQYLKDCFCDHLLINCPECTGEEIISLAAVKIRNQQIYQICNFTRRKYVKSFPTIGYWLSLIPIAPIFSRLVEQFCCAVLPDWFSMRGRTLAAMETYNKPRINIQPQNLMYSLSRIAQFNPANLLRMTFSNFNLIGNLAGDSLLNAITSPIQPRQRTGRQLVQSDLIGKSVTSAKIQLDKSNVSVKGVESYDVSMGLTNVIRAGTAPNRIPPNSEVTLIEQDGVVKFYRVETLHVGTIRDVETEAPAQVDVIQSDIGASLADLHNLVTAKDEEISKLSSQVAELEASQSRLAELEAELVEMREFKREVQRFMSKGNDDKRPKDSK